MNTNTETREWLFALVASKLAPGEIRGERPSLIEIEQWRTGELLQARADEVLSYVAHDEQCHSMWRGLCEEQRWLDSTEGQSTVVDQPLPATAPELENTTGWLGSVVARLRLGAQPMWAGGIAAGLFALLIIPAMFRPSGELMAELYQQQLGVAAQVLGAEFPPVLGRTTKNIQILDGSVVDQDKHQFQLGLSAAASQMSGLHDQRWDTWKASLPPSIDCLDSTTEQCSEQALRNQALGSWSLVTALGCNNKQAEADFWHQQATALNEVAGGAWAQKHFLAARLQKPLPQSREKLCLMATGLLGQGG